MRFKEKRLYAPADRQGDGPATQASRLVCRDHEVIFAEGRTVKLIGLDQTSGDFLEGQDTSTREVWRSSERIQAIAVDPASLACAAVDGVGRVAVSEGLGAPFAEVPVEHRLEEGWCGITRLSSQHKWLVSSMWARKSFIVGEKIEFQHELPPTSVAASPMTSLFAVTEWNDVAYYDPRAPRGGFVERLIGTQIGGGGNGPLWASDYYGHYLCVGGEDRTVSIFDERKHRLVDTWRTPLKDDIVGLRFAPASLPNIKRVIALGLDHEICSQDVDRSSSSVGLSADGEEADEERRTNFGRLHHNHRVFRAKARWSGASISKFGTVFGRDSEGTMYQFVM